jgi:hypothetical protein
MYFNDSKGAVDPDDAISLLLMALVSALSMKDSVPSKQQLISETLREWIRRMNETAFDPGSVLYLINYTNLRKHMKGVELSPDNQILLDRISQNSPIIKSQPPSQPSDPSSPSDQD